MERQIFLFTSVNKVSAEVIVRQLLDFDRKSSDEITMFINSNGGSVVDLFTILNTMDMVKSPIRTVVMGMSASASAVISASGDTRLITEDSEVMLHEVFSVMIGTSSQVEGDFKRVQNMEEKLLKKLSNKTGKSVESLKKMVSNKDKFFSAREAVKFGLADRIIKSNEAQVLKLSEPMNFEGKEFNFNGENDLPEVEMLMEGKFFHPVYGDVVVDDQVLNKIVQNFKDNVRGIDLSIDYTHDNESGENPAGAWIKDLEIRENNKQKKVLVAQVEFTPNGRKLVEEKEYKYASADFSIDYMNESGKHIPYVLRGGTLTNRPFIKEMSSIKLSEFSLSDYKKDHKEINQMNKEELINALKDEGVDVVALTTANESMTAENEQLQRSIKELNALPTEKEEEIKVLTETINDLTSKISDSAKEKAFNDLLAKGKVTPAQKDKVLASFDTVEKLVEFYVDAPQVVKLAPEGSEGEGDGETLTDAENALVKNGTYTQEEIIKNR